MGSVTSYCENFRGISELSQVSQPITDKVWWGWWGWTGLAWPPKQLQLEKSDNGDPGDRGPDWCQDMSQIIIVISLKSHNLNTMTGLTLNISSSGVKEGGGRRGASKYNSWLVPAHSTRYYDGSEEPVFLFLTERSQLHHIPVAARAGLKECQQSRAGLLLVESQTAGS